jgi:hypothetical protein
MRVIEKEVFTYEELSESAKHEARSWWIGDGVEYCWFKDGKDSIEAFCQFFGIKIINYEIGAFSHSWMTTSADKHHFRGLKLQNFNPDYMPTGYCLDCTLWGTFHKTWKETGSPLKAFNEAIDEAVKDIQKDWEYQYSDEAVEEMLILNEYEFTEEGKRYV